MKLFFSIFLFVFCIEAAALTKMGRSDVQSLEVLEDGKYKIVCKDNRVEIVSEEDFLNDKVCLNLIILDSPNELMKVIPGSPYKNIGRTLNALQLTCGVTLRIEKILIKSTDLSKQESGCYAANARFVFKVPGSGTNACIKDIDGVEEYPSGNGYFIMHSVITDLSYCQS